MFDMKIKEIVLAGARQAKKEIEANIEYGQKRDIGWQPFAQSTIEYKKEHHKPLFGLVDTGEMLGSVEIVGVKEDEEGAEIIVKVDDWKAKLHEYGFVNEHGFEVPARPFVSPIYTERSQRDRIVSRMIRETLLQIKKSLSYDN